MIRIIHLSDLHVRTRKHRNENQNAEALTAGILSKCATGNKSKTYVILTGDLLDDGKIKQYKQLERTVLDPLRDKCTVLAAPGNHDYAEWGNFFDKGAVTRFRGYVCDIPPLPDPCIDTCTVSGERNVLFVGVDSADPRDQAFFADGIVDQEQRAALEAKLTDPRYEDYFKVLYLHHHPFLRKWFVSFQQANEFLGLIRGKVDLVLFGHKHVHEPFLRRYEIPAMLASGKVTEPIGDALAFRMIDLAPKGDPAICTVEVPSA